MRSSCSLLYIILQCRPKKFFNRFVLIICTQLLHVLSLPISECSKEHLLMAECLSCVNVILLQGDIIHWCPGGHYSWGILFTGDIIHSHNLTSYMSHITLYIVLMKTQNKQIFHSLICLLFACVVSLKQHCRPNLNEYWCLHLYT